MMTKAREKKEIRESQTLHWRRLTKEVAQENGVLEKVRVRMVMATTVAKVAKWRKELMAERQRKERRHGARERSQGRNQSYLDVWKTGHFAAWCRKGGNRNLYAIEEEDSEHADETIDIEEDLQAWCLLEACENEQWQAATSRRGKQKMKKANQTSLLSVESSLKLNQKEIIEVEDKCVKVRVTMDSGGAGHVMPDTMFPRVKLQRKTSPKTFVAANGEQIRGLGEKRIPLKTNEGIQRCITFRSASVVKPLISLQKVVRAGNVVVLDERNPHIRSIQDRTTTKLDVNSGVYTMDMWICIDETGPVVSWQGQ